MAHDTVTRRRSPTNIPHWRVVFEFNADAPNIIGVDVKGPTIIGRSIDEIGLMVDLDTSVFQSEAKGVSRKHAALMPDDDGVLLVDIGSTNGTYINEKKIEPGTRTRLRIDDTIRMSDLTMRVRLIKRLQDSHAAAFNA